MVNNNNQCHKNNNKYNKFLSEKALPLLKKKQPPLSSLVVKTNSNHPVLLHMISTSSNLNKILKTPKESLFLFILLSKSNMLESADC